LIKETEVLIIGGGPAGLSAAIALGKTKAKVLLIERDPFLGGQLVKQTHMFFGSKEEYAGIRGFEIGEILSEKVKNLANVEVLLNTTAAGYYEEDNMLLAIQNDGRLIRIRFEKAIVATGASEKALLFENNDLIGIYGAGAVQTLMNLYGVLPGKDVVMVGSGNIGLIVSYQLVQAGANVKAIIEAAPKIGGYFVHSAKVSRLGIPIYTSTTIKRAFGKEELTGVEIISLDKNWIEIPGTERKIECDTLCLAVGLSPLTELLWQLGCKMKYIPELGGHIALRDKNLMTSNKNIYIAGDVASIEEATSAMLEGTIAGISVAESLGYADGELLKSRDNAQANLFELRNCSTGEKVLSGIKKLEEEQNV
jgi:sarcosine oxidase subunit alpha